MLKSIFGKTLFEKRWTILIWFVAVLVANFGISLIFPAIRDTMGSMLGQVPESMKNWFGEASTWQTFSGFAGQEIFGQMTTILMVVAIIFGSAFLAGEESSRTLLTLLSRPISRLSVYVQKYLALMVFVAIVIVGFWTGAVLGGLALSQPVPIDKFAACSFVTFLHSLALASIAFTIGAVTGKKGFSGMVVGFYAFIAYFITSLSTATDIVDKLSYAALYRYASGPTTMADGINWTNVLILLLASLIPVIIAAPIFAKRDLQTR
jgi:ABC-2 type transport system permease protein